MNKTVLRSKPITFRSGYPLSSEEINQGFDNLIYDLCNIIGTEMPDWEAAPYADYIVEMKRYSAQINMNLLEENIITKDDRGYTKAWRTI